MTNLRAFLASSTLALALASAPLGCAKGPASPASPSGVPGPQTPASTAARAALCENPVKLDEVPADWVPAEARELVTGQPGQYELAQATLHGITENSEGVKLSATTLTTFAGRERGEATVAQTVSCNGVGPSQRLSLKLEPPEAISTLDGSIHQNRRIKFVLFADRAEHAAPAELVANSPRFGEINAALKAQEENLRRAGVRFDVRTYRVSPTEFELRVTVTSPDQQGGGLKVTINASMRYKLRN